jgi:hypothetical protein
MAGIGLVVVSVMVGCLDAARTHPVAPAARNSLTASRRSTPEA